MKCHLDCKSQSSLSPNSNSKSPLESLANTIWNALRKPAAAAILIGFLLMYVPNNGLAASGGAMGGSSFSSSSDSSSYSSSSSSSDCCSCSSDLSTLSALYIMIILIVGYLAAYLYIKISQITTVLKYQAMFIFHSLLHTML
ncbi:myelin-associated oligodendrocyte basic protein [Trifolium medium]|uniref:Myelin-associated oligodendrocyte basic protein n=1 Tax=Trifolium medium TaxID=97028 RepID=A0A392NEX6_9FABA|nr:myelin-associated oligodendrocyte basic protein [Trifolium medium]